MITCKTKKWGHSLGVIIPSSVVKDMNLKPNEEIVLEKIEKKSFVLKEMFGFAQNKNTINAEKLIGEARKDLKVD